MNKQKTLLTSDHNGLQQPSWGGGEHPSTLGSGSPSAWTGRGASSLCPSARSPRDSQSQRLAGQLSPGIQLLVPAPVTRMNLHNLSQIQTSLWDPLPGPRGSYLLKFVR